MAQRPLLPMRLSLGIIEEVKRFVDALMQARKHGERAPITECLFEKDPMFQGPFASVSLPYQQTTSGEWPLHKSLKPDFTPFIHQMQAFDRLGADVKQHTIVTTGTGSGKSECFIYPILDEVIKQKKAGRLDGVKALILYPMNALIDDQSTRLCEIANKANKELSPEQQIRVGRYTGNPGANKAMNPHRPKAIIDDRQALCHQVPDILLTNYRMLDLMLLRPEEQSFWGNASQAAFEFLVLDELHTFDGAQGADVALLIRRLRLKLKRSFTCIGTSATVAGKQDDHQAKDKLCAFASTLFGTPISRDSIVEAHYQDAASWLQLDTSLSTPFEPMQQVSNDYAGYLKNLCTHWHAPEDPVACGQWLRKHPLTTRLIHNDKLGLDIQLLAQALDTTAPLLAEFFDLIAFARVERGKTLGPLLPLQVQCWVAETPYLLRKLGNEPAFVRSTASDLPSSEFLPAIHCRTCGMSGLLTLLYDRDDGSYQVEWEPKIILDKFFAKNAVVLFPGAFDDHLALKQLNYDSEMERFYTSPEGDSSVYTAVFFNAISQEQVFGRKRGDKAKVFDRCPACQSNLSLALTQISASMLGSVLTGRFLSDDSNPDDKKLLVFNDSVQDAAHQAGYISARTFRFNFRRFLWQHISMLLAKNEPLTLSQVLATIDSEVNTLWQKSSEGDQEARSILIKLISQDLWQRLQAESKSLIFERLKNKDALSERLHLEGLLELTLQSGLGWSLKKSGQCQLQLPQEVIEQMAEIATTLAELHHCGTLNHPISFAMGFGERLIERGIVANDLFKECYHATSFAMWPLFQHHPALSGFFGNHNSSPSVLIKRHEGKKKHYDKSTTLLSSNGQGWFDRWTRKHMTQPKKENIQAFLAAFFDRISQIDGLFISFNERIVLNPDTLLLRTEFPATLQCQRCSHQRQWPLKAIQKAMCTQHLCKGEMHRVATHNDVFHSYLKESYERPITATFAKAHTGQLGGQQRRRVEEAFRDDLVPGAAMQNKQIYHDHPVNVLCCTQTLEMGIDIGSLSGVLLRSFPKNTASFLQRVGRAGRSSGNALNMTLVSRKPHDRFHWQNPQEIFAGSVSIPGCDLQTKDLIERQFNAYVLDSFVSENPELAIPKRNELDAERTLTKEVFWQQFKTFLQSCSATAMTDTFINQVRQGLDKEVPDFFPELNQHLRTHLDSQELWTAVENVLIAQDKWYQQRKNKSNSSEQQLNSLQQHQNQDQQDDEREEAERQVASNKQRIAAQQPHNDTLLQLAHRGILPNYAFPDQGICLHAAVSNRRSASRSTQTFEIQRPPVQGIAELAPGQYFYANGFKLPICRYEKNGQELLRVLACEQCGTVTSIEDATLEHTECTTCSAQSPVVSCIEPRDVYASGDIGDLIIDDRDDSREQAKLQREVFVSYKDQPGLTWHSNDGSYAIEFAERAQLYFMVRGQMGVKGIEPFRVCPDCWAIPTYIGEIQADFKLQNTANRHEYGCKFYSHEKMLKDKLASISLMRSYQSDSLRFFVEHDKIASVEAALALMLRLNVGGDPAHLARLITYLKGHENGSMAIIHIYDTVPGGSGHLSSLMPSGIDVGHTLHGLKRLQEGLKKAFYHLQACKCKAGCYKCLYRYDNQYRHEKINKTLAMHWLSGFATEDDWVASKRVLNHVLTNDARFDSKTESMLIEALRSSRTQLPGAFRVREIKETPTACFRITTESRQKYRFEHCNDVEERLPSRDFRHTKPDFRMINPNGEKCAFFYLDGKRCHLNPDEYDSTFALADVSLRRLLRDRDGNNSVYTLTFDMVEAWCEDHNPQTRPSTLADDLHFMLTQLKDHFKNSTIPPDYKSIADRKTLYSTFVDAVFSRSIGNPDLFWNSTDAKTLRSLLEALYAVNKTRWGGLEIVKSDGYSLRMRCDPSLRLDANADLDPAYVLSWEMFWILWVVDPDIISFEKTTQVIAPRNPDKPDGWSHLKKSQVAAGELLLKRGIDSILSDVSGLDTAPLFYKKGHYAIYDTIEIMTLDPDMPQILEDGTRVILFDFLTDPKSILNHLDDS